MIVRIKSMKDIVSTVRELGPIFKAASGIPGDFRPEIFIASWENILRQNTGAMFVASDNGKIYGLLGAILMIDPFDGLLVAAEAAWFIHPDYRGPSALRLFEEFERWALAVGAERILAAHLNSNFTCKMGKFFRRHGYCPVETIYRKEL